MHLFLKLTNLIANNCIKLLLLTYEQYLCEMAQVKNAARNGAVCYHNDSKEIFVLLCLFLPQGPTLYTEFRRFSAMILQKDRTVKKERYQYHRPQSKLIYRYGFSTTSSLWICPPLFLSKAK